MSRASRKPGAAGDWRNHRLMDAAALGEGWLASLSNERRLSAHTLRAYRATLERFLAHLNLAHGRPADAALLESLTTADIRAFLAGNPPKKIVKRVIRAQIKLGAPVKYLAHYDMNNCTEETRAAFMAKVRREMENF